MASSERDWAVTVLRRTPLLAACRDGPRLRRELTDSTDLSRPTIYRATDSLVDAGLLEQTSEGYRTTPRGTALLAASESYTSAIETVDRLEPLLDLVDHPELARNVHLLAGAEVVVADASNPYRVVDRVTDRLDRVDRSRGTIVNPTAVEALDHATDAIESTESIERVFTASAMDAHETVADDEFRAVAEHDSLSLLVAPDDALPFSFAIDDDAVTLVGHDPATGLPTVHVASDHPPARVWLEAVYDRCRSAAEPVEF